jgi:choline dehydrogenase-like flavoprotein
MGIATNSHQCGTARFGGSGHVVLDPYCRTHDVDNLYVVDSSFFPSSAAMNPALTIAAQALRVAEQMRGNDSIDCSTCHSMYEEFGAETVGQVAQSTRNGMNTHTAN